MHLQAISSLALQFCRFLTSGFLVQSRFTQSKTLLPARNTYCLPSHCKVFQQPFAICNLGQNTYHQLFSRAIREKCVEKAYDLVNEFISALWIRLYIAHRIKSSHCLKKRLELNDSGFTCAMKVASLQPRAYLGQNDKFSVLTSRLQIHTIMQGVQDINFKQSLICSFSIMLFSQTTNILQYIMKVVKRVSLLKSLSRITEPSKEDPKMDRIFWNKNAPYRLTTQQELVKFGYKNYKHSIFLVSAAVLAFFSGALFQTFQMQLLDNEREAIYRYKSKERQHSGILLGARLILYKLLHQVIGGNLFPFYQFQQLRGNDNKIQEKHVRYQQYRHFMAKRENKYDFLELGVLEKFPFPVTQTAPQLQSQ